MGLSLATRPDQVFDNASFLHLNVLSPDHQQNDKQINTNASGPGIKEVDTTAHNTVPDDQYQTNRQFTYLQRELAAYSVEGKKLHHLYCGKYPDVPQVAPRTTREGPYLYCHLSYTFVSPAV